MSPSRPDGRPDFDENDPAQIPVGDDYQSCPSCGCPHALSATVCSFCQTPLTRKVTLAERWRRKYHAIREEHARQGDSWKIRALVKKAGSNLLVSFLGGVLTIGGIFLMVSMQSATAIMVGLLFVLYGGYTLYHLYGSHGQ